MKTISNNELLKTAALDFFNQSHEYIYITDVDGFILAINDQLSYLTGYTSDELIGRHTRILKSGIHDILFYKNMWESIKLSRSWHGELTNRKKDGTFYTVLTTIKVITDENNNPLRYLSVGRDISTMIFQIEKLKEVSFTDDLTKLHNRLALNSHFSSIIPHHDKINKNIGILFLDLDGFKDINDNYGHKIGDIFLKKISATLNNTIRTSDFIARIGGDEFVILLTNSNNELDLTEIINKILKVCSLPIDVNGICLNVTASIGVSYYRANQHCKDPQTLIRQADQAMYISKMEGKNKIHFYNSTRDDPISTREELVGQIVSSLDNGDFIIYYQPKMDIVTGKLYGVESLIRWKHPERGILNPGEFLPFVRKTALSILIDDLVIFSVLKQQNDWCKIGLDIPISINLEPPYIEQSNFVDKITSLFLKFPDIKKSNISFEILETGLLCKPETINKLKQLNEFGILFSLDDFGIGYSSLSYIKDLPLSSIKIDRSFIQELTTVDYTKKIVKHIIDLARSLNLEVIAEGIETIEQGSTLIELGCTLGQGYYIAKPMSPTDLPIWIRNWTLPTLWSNKK